MKKFLVWYPDPEKQYMKYEIECFIYVTRQGALILSLSDKHEALIYPNNVLHCGVIAFFFFFFFHLLFLSLLKEKAPGKHVSELDS